MTLRRRLSLTFVLSGTESRRQPIVSSPPSATHGLFIRPQILELTNSLIFLISYHNYHVLPRDCRGYHDPQGTSLRHRPIIINFLQCGDVDVIEKTTLPFPEVSTTPRNRLIAKFGFEKIEYGGVNFIDTYFR